MLESTFGCNISNATEFGEIEYSNTYIDYSKIDKESTLQLADFYFNKALKEEDSKLRAEYLQKASGEYHILTHAQPDNLYPIIQMARVYDMEQENRFAKAYFFQALKIDKNNADTNYYFGDFYYKRREYTKALYFYNKAFKNGFKSDYEVFIKMGTIYEKLGDLLKANQYYKRAYMAKPTNEELPDKIREIEDLRYKNTGYYNKRKK